MYIDKINLFLKTRFKWKLIAMLCFGLLIWGGAAYTIGTKLATPVEACVTSSPCNSCQCCASGGGCNYVTCGAVCSGSDQCSQNCPGGGGGGDGGGNQSCHNCWGPWYVSTPGAVTLFIGPGWQTGFRDFFASDPNLHDNLCEPVANGCHTMGDSTRSVGVAAGMAATLYEHQNYGGASRYYASSVYDIWASDWANVVSSIIVHDVAGPYITSWGTYGAWTKSTTLTFADAKSMSGGGVRCQFGSWPVNSNPGNGTYTCTINDAYQNNAPLYIRVWDGAGNQTTYDSSGYGVRYYLDNTPPYLTSWGTYGTAAAYNWTKTATVTATDGVSMGGGGMRCSLDGWPVDSNPGNSTTSCSFSDAYRVRAGMYIRVWDFLGNQVTYYSPSYGVYYDIDNTAPAAPAIMTTSWYGDHWIPASGFVASTTGGTDNSGTVTSYRLCRSNDNTGGCSVWVTPATTNANGSTVTVSGTDLPCSGCYRYYYWFGYDAAGNQSTNSTGQYVRLDGAAPTHDSISVSSSWWGAGNTYGITLKSTEALTGIGGNYGMMALINYSSPTAGPAPSNGANPRGYFSWLPSGTPAPWGTSVADTVTCSGAGGGTASKYNAGYGNTTTTLAGCSSTVSGNQRTVTFNVVPNATFGSFGQINDISFYTTDYAGNAAGWTNFDTNFGSDMTAPTTPTITTEPSASTGTSNTVGATPSTDTGGSGGIQYEFCMNTSGTAPPNGGICNQTSSGWLGTPSHTFSGLVDNTTYYYWVRSRDAAGNTTGWSGPTSSRQDSSAPTNIVTSSPTCGGGQCSTSSTTPTNGSGTITLTTTAGDPPCVTNCISRVEYWLNGTTLVGSSTTAPFSINWNTTGLAPGNYTLTVKVYDVAGNVTTKDYFFYIENNLPSIAVTYAASGGYSAYNGGVLRSAGGQITLSGTASDPDSGLDQILKQGSGYSYSTNSPASPKNPSTLAPVSYMTPNGTKTTFNWYKNVSDNTDPVQLNGWNSISMLAKDKSGNYSNQVPTLVYVDKSAPVAPNANLTAGCGTSNYQWNYSFDVGVGNIQKNNEYISTSPNYQYVAGSSYYLVTLNVTNSAGAAKTVYSGGAAIPTLRAFSHVAWVDGGAQPPAVTESLSGLASGDTVTYRIKAIDRFNNTSTETVRSVTIASGVAPSVPTGLSPNSSSSNWRNSAAFSWTTGNNNNAACNQGISHQVRFRRVGDTTWTYSTPSTSFPINVAFPVDGAYEWQAQDTEVFSGQVSGWSGTSTVQIDTTAPVVTYGTAPTVRDVPNNTNTFRIGVIDNVPGSGLNGGVTFASPPNGTPGSFGAFYFNPVTNQWVPVTTYRYQLGGAGPFVTVDANTPPPIGYDGNSDVTFDFDIPLQIGGIYVDKYCARVADRAGNFSSTWNCTTGFDTIVYDSGSTGTTGSTNASTVTWPHTTGTGSDKMMIVEVSHLGGSGANVSSVNYGTTPLTFLRRDGSGTDIVTELWYLASPASGTFNITVNTASPTSIVAGATTWFGVDPTLGPSGGAFNTTANSSPALNISSSAGQVVVDVVGTKTKVPVPTPASGQILRWGNESGFNDGAVSSKSGPTTSMNWTLPDPNGSLVNDMWAISAVTLRPAATAGGDTQIINTSWFQVTGGNIHSNYGVDALPAPPSSNQYVFDQKLSLSGLNRTVNGASSSVSLENYDSTGTANALGKKTITYPSYADLYQRLYVQSDPTVTKQTYSGNQAINQASFDGLASGGSVVYINGNATLDTSATFSGSGAGRKNVVVFVSGTFTFNNNLTVAADNTFVVIAKGGINISSVATTVDGYFVSEGVINTAYDVTTFGTTTPALTIRGGLAAIPINGGDGTTDYLKLNRNLGSTNNSTSPAEKIIFEPKYYIWAQKTLGQTDYTWSEATP